MVTTATRYKKYTSGSGTYTPANDVQSIKVYMMGGGGGGSGAARSTHFLSNQATYEGGGGGAGATYVLTITNAQLKSSYAYSIGAGGSAGSGSAGGGDQTSSAGGDGGRTRFGDWYVAGGFGGSNAYASQVNLGSHNGGGGNGGSGGVSGTGASVSVYSGGKGGDGDSNGSSGYGRGQNVNLSSSSHEFGGPGGGCGDSTTYSIFSDNSVATQGGYSYVSSSDTKTYYSGAYGGGGTGGWYHHMDGTSGGSGVIVIEETYISTVKVTISNGDSNGGTLSGTTSFNVAYNGSLVISNNTVSQTVSGTTKTATCTVKSGYTFYRWELSSHTRVTSSTTFNTDTTVYSTYTVPVSFASNNTSYGTVSSASQTLPTYGSYATSINSNELGGTVLFYYTVNGSTTTLATVTATATNGNKLSSWNKSSGKVVKGLAFTATFARIQYSYKFQSNDTSAGTVNTSYNTSVVTKNGYYGDTVTCTAYPKSTSQLLYWSYNGGNATSQSGVSVSGNTITITCGTAPTAYNYIAVFLTYHTVNFSTSRGISGFTKNGSSVSSISVASGSTISKSGNTITIDGNTVTAVLEDGYSFYRWEDANHNKVSGSITQNTRIYAIAQTAISFAPQDSSYGTVSTSSLTKPTYYTYQIDGNAVYIKDYSGNTVNTITASANAGSEFSYWSVSGQGSGSTISKGISFTAYYNRIQYTYSFQSADSGMGSIQYNNYNYYNSWETVYYGQQIVLKAVPLDSHFKFVRWTYNGSEYSTSATITLTGGTSNTEFPYVAVFDTDMKQITVYKQPSGGGTYYDSFDFDGSNYSQTYTQKYVYRNIDYTIVWYGTTTVTEANYLETTTIYDNTQRTITPSSVSSVYPSTPTAQQTTYSYRYRAKVSFNANGGNADSTPTGNTSTYITSDWSSNQSSIYVGWVEVIPTRSGYTFLGWSTNSSATEPDVNSGTSYYYAPSNTSYTLYAVWKKGYRVTIKVASGQSSRGTVTPSSAFLDSGETLSILARPNTGYTFDHWSLSGSSGASISNIASESTTLTMGNAIVTVTAYFLYAERNITFRSNWGSDNVLANISTNTNGTLQSLPSTPTREEGGYDYPFKEWNTSSDGTGTSITSTSDVLPVNVTTLYAIWETPQLVITYQTLNNSVPDFTQTFGPGQVIILPSAGSRTNFYFAGWCIGQTIDANIIGTVGSPYTVTANVTMTAYWKNTPQITFNAGNGKFTSGQSTFTKYTVVSDGYAYIDSMPENPTYTATNGMTLAFDRWTYQGNTVTTSTQWELGRNYIVNAEWIANISSDYNISWVQNPSTVTIGQKSYFEVQVTPSTEWQDVRWEITDRAGTTIDTSFSISYVDSGNTQRVSIVPSVIGREAKIWAYCSVDNTKYVSANITSTTQTTVSFYVDSSSPTYEIATNGILQSLPSQPYLEGYVFDNWLDDNGNVVEIGTIVLENLNAYAHFTAIETSETMGKDTLILQVFNKEKDAIVTSLDMGSIQTFTETYSIKTTSTPTPTMSSEKTFIIDMSIQETITVRFIRSAPPDSFDGSNDSSIDSKRWSNAKWQRELKKIINRWQGATDGLKLLYIPLDCASHDAGDGSYPHFGTYYRLVGTPNPDPNSNIGYLFNGQRYIGVNAYIKSYTPTYSAGIPEVLSGTITIYVGGMTSNYERWTD